MIPAASHQPRAAGNGRPYLGITAKSLHRPQNQGLSAGQRLNFKLQRTAQSLLFRRGAEKQHRTCWCCRTVQGDGVAVKRRADGMGARLSGVGTCGSVWACPVCAAKITEGRRAELMEGMARAKALGFAPFLLTLTTPHGREHVLVDLLASFQKALTSFKNSKTYKNTMIEAGRLGSIRSLEVTWGQENGWHPHTHDLVFVREGFEHRLDVLKDAWFKALKKAGLADDPKLGDVLEHGLDLRDGTYAAEYVAKFGREATNEGWGLSGELTKSHAKIGMRSGRFSPFQILAFAEHGDDHARVLFAEFAEAFEGKRMLSYSPGLKKEIGQGDLSDEVLASMDTPMPDEEHAGSLSIDDFHEVVKRGAVPDLLDFAAKYLVEAETAQADLDEWLTWLKSTPATMGGALRQRRHFGSGPLMEVFH